MTPLDPILQKSLLLYLCQWPSSPTCGIVEWELWHLAGIMCDVFSMWPLFNIKEGCESYDVISSLCGLLFRLWGDIEYMSVIFLFGHDRSYSELGIYTPTLIILQLRSTLY